MINQIILLKWFAYSMDDDYLCNKQSTFHCICDKTIINSVISVMDWIESTQLILSIV